MTSSHTPTGLTSRARAMLVAAADDRAEIALSCEPDLYIDGLPCCDQFTARQLWHAGLMEAATTAGVGRRVRATLTAAGRAALSVVAA